MKLNENFLIASVIANVTWAITSSLGVDYPFYIFVLIFLISYPWKIGKDVYSIFGGFNEEDGGSVYSLFALIQKAEKNTYTLFGLTFYQNAGEDAVQFIGLALYQNAGEDAVQFIGLALYQKAGEDAIQCIGLSLYQKAGVDALQFVGLSLYQNAGGDAVQDVGLTVFSEATSFSNKTFAVIRAITKTKIKSVVQV